MLVLLLSCSLWGCDACGSSSASLPVRDDFERPSLGPHWEASGGQWFIEDGALHSPSARNEPLWLDASLPRDVEISMTAWSMSPAVDLKFEVFGDGTHHQSGYVVIAAGWNNSTSIIARLDEHGRERTPAMTEKLRAEVQKDPAQAARKYRDLRERISRKAQLQPGRRYRLRLLRRDHWLRFYIDDQLHLEYFDPSPLAGPGHDRFAFNNWEAQVYFDDLLIEPLHRDVE